MTNLILFANTFLSYLFVLIFIAVLVVIACIFGVKWKKSSDMKIKKIEEAETSVTPESIELKE